MQKWYNSSALAKELRLFGIIPSTWASWRLKYMVTLLFVHQLDQANVKESIKALY